MDRLSLWRMNSLEPGAWKYFQSNGRTMFMIKGCSTHLLMAGRAAVVNDVSKSTAYRVGSCDSGMSAA